MLTAVIPYDRVCPSDLGKYHKRSFTLQPVNENGILWLGIIAVAINVLASLVVRKEKTENESILSLFLEDSLGWLAVILMAIILRLQIWYILDPLYLWLFPSLFCRKSFLAFGALKIFLDAVPEGVETSDLRRI